MFYVFKLLSVIFMSPKPVKITTVCGAGVGSSVMLRVNILDILRKYNVDGIVNTGDVATWRGYLADIVITQPVFEQTVEGTKAKVIILHNFVSMKELEEKLVPALRELGFLK